MNDREPEPTEGTEASELVLVFPDDLDVPDGPNLDELQESIPPEGPPIGDVDPNQVIPRWQWG